MKRCPNPACASMQFPDEANFCPSCAQRLVPAEDGAASDAGDDRLGGRFVLGPRIGGHRTGEIYAATDTQTQAECVVKFVHDAVFPTPLLRQRSERELKQLERVQAATVARVLAHGKRGDQLWVAVEKVDGQPLKALVSQGVLPVERARAILLAIGDALSEAAKVGVIHRDVSPKNVLVGPGDAVKVINFGIPTPLKDKVQGEPEFLSPEQVEGKPVDQRSNIYSLGAIFYYMLVGQPPYIGDADAVMQAHLQGDLVPPSQRGTVPPAVEAIIVKALDRVSSKRYMTLRQLLTEVERVDVAGGGKPAASAAKGPAKTMLGMFAPSIGAVGADGKPTEPVLMNPQATGADAPGAVATFAPPTGPVAAPPQAAPPQAGQAAAEPAPPQAAPPQAGQAAAEPAPPPPQAGQAAAEPAPPSPPSPPPQAAAEPAPPSPPAAAPPQAAGDVVSSASPPPPVVPGAPSVPQAAAGAPSGKKKAEPTTRKKGQFRETLWFKKGELDAVAAEAAAAAAAQGKDELAVDKVDLLPVEDRYADDGSVSVQDQQAYSLRTGHTQMMKAVDPAAVQVGPGMKEDELISEMKGGSGKLVAIGVGAVLLLAVVAYLLLK